jgi:hypothetical protein
VLRAFGLTVLAVLSSGCGSEQLTAPPADPSSSPEYVVAHTRTIQVFPLVAPLINACYNYGVGESISLSGSIVLTIETVIHSSGKSVEILHVKTKGVHGIGLTSGMQYQVMEHQNTVTHFGADGTRRIVFVFLIRTIGAGRGDNELLTSRFHLIITPDGTRELLFDTSHHTCH